MPPRRSDRAPVVSGLAAAARGRRLQLGLTQQQLANLADVSRSSVQSLEAGQTGVTLDVAQAVFRALGLALVATPLANADD